MTTKFLKKRIDTNVLNDIYTGKDYYWYLNHDMFVETCLKYVANVLDKISNESSVLDVGCGFGTLLKVLKPSHSYVGFDLSKVALERARSLWKDRPNTEFIECGIETFPYGHSVQSDCIVSGNCLIYVKPEAIVDLMKRYVEATGAKHIIVYEIGRAKTASLEKQYELVERKNFYIPLEGLQEVKRHRKVEVYKV